MPWRKRHRRFWSRRLGIDPKFVSVSIQDIPLEDWAKSMEQFSEDILFVKPGV